MTVPYPPPTSPYPEQSQANAALVMSILGFCGPLGLIGLVMGWQEMAAIREGRRPPEKREVALAAFSIGVLWMVVLAGMTAYFLGTSGGG